MSKGVVIFIEGDTEEEFFRRLISQLHSYTAEQRFSADKLVIRNLKGIGNYKARAKRVFAKEILNMYPDMNFTVILCYDTDVFDFSAKPAVVWVDVEKELKDAGATKVVHIKAKHSIEDWFLLDQFGVLKYLKLPDTTSIPSLRGAEKMKALFKKAGKVYIKGSATKGFVDALQISRIMVAICSELRGLCKELGIKCDGKICESK